MANCNADRSKVDSGKRQPLATMLNVAYGRHCDMTGIPAVRLSDCKRTNRPIFSIRLSFVMGSEVIGGLFVLKCYASVVYYLKAV